MTRLQGQNVRAPASVVSEKRPTRRLRALSSLVRVSILYLLACSLPDLACEAAPFLKGGGPRVAAAGLNRGHNPGSHRRMRPMPAALSSSQAPTAIGLRPKFTKAPNTARPACRTGAARRMTGASCAAADQRGLARGGSAGSTSRSFTSLPVPFPPGRVFGP